MPRPTFKKSIVWAFFDASSDRKTVVCKLCKKAYTNHKNTSNFKEHLRRIHPIQLTQEEDLRAGRISDAPSTSAPAPSSSSAPASGSSARGPSSSAPRPISSSSAPGTDSSPSGSSRSDGTNPPPAKRSRQLRLYAGHAAGALTEEQTKELDEALVIMVVKDYQPLSIVEDEGFSMFVRKLNPRYQLPSRKTLSEKLLPAYYEKKRAEFFIELRNADFISLTADYWKALNNKAFLSLTAHYIFQNELHSTTLAAAEVKVSHTGTNTSCVIKQICDTWEITNKVVTVVTDNAANMKKAVTEDLQKHHHPCVAHTLNLTVNDSIAADAVLGDLLNKCRGIVTHFRQSTVAAYKLKEKQAELNVAELLLKQDIATRWNSTFTMLERLAQVQQPLCLALLELDRAPEGLTASEWASVKDLLPILKPFLEFTTQLSGEKYVTMSIIVPLIRGLRYALRMALPSTDVGMRFRDNLSDFVARRLGCLETNKIIAKATFLDPRFKKSGFGQEDHASNVQQWVLDELTRLEADSMPLEHDPLVRNQTIPDGEINIWSHFDQRTLEQRHHSTPHTTALVMVRQYLELPLLDRRRDPLSYWENYSKTFPGLYKMAKKYLAIPASSVPSERLFSKAGYVLTERRNRLTSEKLNEIVFLNNNVRVTK